MTQEQPTADAHNRAFKDILNTDLSQCEVSFCLASVGEDLATPHFQRVQTQDDLTEEFRQVVRSAMSGYSKMLSRGDLVLCDYAESESSDDYEVECMDLTEHDFIASQITSLASLAGLGTFKYDDDFVSGLRFYVIVAQPPQGSPIYYFRTYSAKRQLQRSKSFGAWMDEGQFDKVKEPIFLFDQHIDCVSRGNVMFVFNRNLFQQIFQFFEMVRNAGRETLDKIKGKVPIKNFEEFSESCMRHPNKLAKLRNIANNPLLKSVSLDDLKKIMNDFDLPLELIQENGQEMFVYDSSNQWVLLRLLEDGFMKSELTDQPYEIIRKRPHRRRR